MQSTKKITRAMELIAASRIVKAQARVHAAQPYADGITGVMRDLAAAGAGSNNPLLSGRASINSVAHIVIAADRGLCGGYNAQIVRTTEREMRQHTAAGRENVLVTSGRKPESYFRFRAVPIEASFTGFSDSPNYEDARAIAASVAQKFLDGEIDRVQIVYTKFVSAGRQEVVIEPLMPLDVSGATSRDAAEVEAPGGASAASGGGAAREAQPSGGGVASPSGREAQPSGGGVASPSGREAQPSGGGVASPSGREAQPSGGGVASPSGREAQPSGGGVASPSGREAQPSGGGYEYEPAPEVILDALLPRYAEARVFAALLNAAASEHTFRQRAMKAATDNADELIRTLSRVMNRARQDAITTEIMEIVGGAEALGQGGDVDDDLFAAS